VQSQNHVNLDQKTGQLLSMPVKMSANATMIDLSPPEIRLLSTLSIGATNCSLKTGRKIGWLIDNSAAHCPIVLKSETLVLYVSTEAS